ncbi:hypothetical protein [Mangrovimonas sp. TPBH4]|uniref:hypothetical protein n=1 Tax=Mangrovimonas sp. TPBH4 TaxID=1645914 RepID=UPI0006B4B3AC|nr:hypothetical protein [Mangrovimonas sp. TPBH4]
MIPVVSISQEEEYIVTKYDDTIYGKVIRGTNYLDTSEVVFKFKNKAGDKIRIDASEIKTIRSIKGVDGDCYITTIYDALFIKKIIDGRIKVYQLVDGAIFYASKDDSEITSTDIGEFFSRKKAHSQVRPMIQDNVELLKEFDTLPGNQKNIFYIINKYNSSVY